MKSNDVTIKDIASKAGVSVSTVSRVLNNNYPVSEEVRNRVLEIVEMLQYKPNSVAKNLRSKKSQMIGLVVADIANNFFMQLAKGIESVIVEYGYHIMIATSDGNVDKERQVLTAMLPERPAALIVTTFDSESRHLQDFIDTGIPVIMADRFLKGLDSDAVISDNFEAAYKLTSLLLEQGHKDIAIANVLLSISTGRERYEGYLKALDEYGLKPNTRYVSSGNFDAESSEKWVTEIFSGDKRPSALVGANNIMTIGALRAFRKLSLNVPKDVSMVSIGTMPFQDLIEPRITSSVQNGYEMGVIAGEMALRRIEKGIHIKSKRQVVQMPISVSRSSLAPPYHV